MNIILIYPILLPLAMGLICLILPRRARALREALAILTALASLGLGIYIFGQPGLQLSLDLFTVEPGLKISIDLLVTPFARLILVATPAFAFLVMLYSFEYMSEHSLLGEYLAFSLIALGTAAGTALADSLVALLIFWELFGLMLYLLIIVSGSEAISSATKALVITIFGDMCLLLGIAFLWLENGTLSLSQLSAHPQALSTPLSLMAYILLMAAAFAKAGAIPLHSWIPAISTTAPIPTMAYLPASLDKLLGIYLLARISLELFVMTPVITLILMGVGSITILGAVLMALIQHDYRKMLAFHAVSQVGYMVLGIGTGTPLGAIGGLFHMLNHAIYKCCLFLCGGSVQHQTKRTEFSELGGLASAMPWTFAACFIAALAISGVPPMNGFVSKWLVYQGILQWGGPLYPLFLGIAMFGSALTLASFMKLMYSMFWGERAEGLERVVESRTPMLIPLVVLAAFSLAFGIFYTWPVKTLIQPLFAQTASVTGIPGLWDAGLATILLILSLLAGVPIYLLSRTRQSREADVFLGGEALPSELYRVRGTHFYGPVKEFGGLRRLYKLGEAGDLDLYQYATRGLNAAARLVYKYVDQALTDFYQEIVPSLLNLGGQILRLLNSKFILTYVLWATYAAGAVGLILYPGNANMESTLRVVACTGMVGWGILALVETDLKRMLVLAATSQVGFVLLGLTLSGDVAVSYLITGSIALFVLFLLGFSISRSLNTSNIDQMSGVAANMPLRFLLFLLAALWLSGLPPFGSFFSKFLLGVAAGKVSPILTIVITGSALITLAYLLRPIRRFLRAA